MGGGILALDLSSATGWAAGSPGETPRAGTRRIGRPGQRIGAFLDIFDRWLSDQITVHQPAVLIFEAPILTAGKTSIDTARKLMCLAGVTELIAFRREIPRVFEADSSTVTKFFTGRGSYGNRDAKKAAVMEQCRQLGWQPCDDNAADALALWRWAEFKLYPKARTPDAAPLPIQGAA